MKGLLKNNFIGVIENLKLLFPLAIIFGIIVSITGNASLLSIYSLSITPILLLLVVLCMRKETYRNGINTRFHCQLGETILLKVTIPFTCVGV